MHVNFLEDTLIFMTIIAHVSTVAKDCNYKLKIGNVTHLETFCNKQNITYSLFTLQCLFYNIDIVIT
jgi:hypothetical protein